MEPQSPEQSNSQSLTADQPTSLEDLVVGSESDDVSPPEGRFSWDASEYVVHEKPTAWYGGLFLIAAIFAAALAWFQQWTGSALVVVMTLAIVVYSRKEPRILQYEVDSHGIHISGKLQDYHLFKSYSLHPQVGWCEIDFEPSKRFAQRLTILCDDESFEQIEAILKQHLPRVDREPDFVEKLTRYVKF